MASDGNGASSARPRTREETKQETRRALLTAGLLEIGAKGLDAPSLDDICARAGYTRGAFYVHFKDREDFLVQLMDSIFIGFINEMLAADAENPDMDGVIGRYTEALASGDLPTEQSGVRLSQLLEAGARFPRVRTRGMSIVGEIWERLTKRTQVGQAEESIRNDTDAEVLGMLLVALAVGGIALKELGLELDMERFKTAVLGLLKPPA